MATQSKGLLFLSLMAGLVLALVSLGSVQDVRAQQSTSETTGPSHSGTFDVAQSYYYPYYRYPNRRNPNYRYPQVRQKKRKPRKRRVTIKCAFPWTYSRGLQKCICVRDEYAVSGGQCIKLADLCPQNAEWSAAAKKCLCQDGFAETGGKCAPTGTGLSELNPAEGTQCVWPRVASQTGSACTCALGYREDAGLCVRDGNPVLEQRRHTTSDELLTDDVALVQQCLKEAGYLRTSVQRRMGKKAWSAYWFFKQDHSIGRTPKGVHNAKAQQRLFTLCPQASTKLAALPAAIGQLVKGPASGAPLPGAPATKKVATAGKPQSGQQQAALTPVPANPDVAPKVQPAPEVKAPIKPVYARPEAGCLPDDLYQLIVKTYGGRSKLRRCTQTCIAMPANITKREAEAYEAKQGVRWCRSCIEIGTHLPLEDILTIEKGANVQVCTRPPSRLPRWASPSRTKRPSFTRARALYRALPPGVDDQKTIAVIIGNGSYNKGLPTNASAHASAGAMYSLLTEHLGYQQENIIDLRDASLDDMTKVFGSAEDHHGDLSKLLKSKPDAHVLIYFAGHAGTHADLSASYLLPVDAVKYREDRTGYSLSQLYANLEKVGAKSTLVMLEANFARDLSEFVFPPNLPGLQSKALPEKPIKGLTVLTASDGDQKTLDDPKFGIGLFTRYLIEGLAGRADLAPIGNKDRRIDAIELYAYTSHMVRLTARKSFGLLQKPTVSRSGNLRVSRVQSQSQ